MPYILMPVIILQQIKNFAYPHAILCYSLRFFFFFLVRDHFIKLGQTQHSETTPWKQLLGWHMSAIPAL